mgnify:CR=1 FL=1
MTAAQVEAQAAMCGALMALVVALAVGDGLTPAGYCIALGVVALMTARVLWLGWTIRFRGPLDVLNDDLARQPLNLTEDRTPEQLAADGDAPVAEPVPCSAIASATWCCEYHAIHSDDDFAAALALLVEWDKWWCPGRKEAPMEETRAFIDRWRPLPTRTKTVVAEGKGITITAVSVTDAELAGRRGLKP